MQRLIEGVHKFRVEAFGRYRDLFHKLAHEGQHPQTLFITCADSRVLAELITQSQPGELFVVKNVGNIVPPASATGRTNSTSAAIEFAVEVLGVHDIVVCGHSQCGAMGALMRGGVDGALLPHFSRWLELAAPVRDVVNTLYFHLSAEAERQRAAEEENVLFALGNLLTYPCFQARLADQQLNLHGWFYRIGTGELFAYDPVGGQFQPLLPPAETKPA
ncbi:MAG: carbonic anhydrase [Verrucomicrobia bacterium]|nr:carbonic anhydrase [Verrucomicrobiota bacterium]